MSSSFLRDFYRRYYGKEMLQRALCLLTVHRKKPYNNSGSFEKRKEIIFMSHKIIKPEGIELIEYLNNGYAICNRCGAVMRQAEDPKTGCGVYICPSCGLKVDEEDYEYESDEEVEWTEEMLDMEQGDIPPAGRRACGGPYPYCKMSCKLFDD
jgi:hypothetical protein